MPVAANAAGPDMSTVAIVGLGAGLFGALVALAIAVTCARELFRGRPGIGRRGGRGLQGFCAEPIHGHHGQPGNHIFAEPGPPTSAVPPIDAISCDLYVNILTNDLWQFSSGQWVLIGNLAVPQIINGVHGTTGPWTFGAQFALAQTQYTLTAGPYNAGNLFPVPTPWVTMLGTPQVISNIAAGVPGQEILLYNSTSGPVTLTNSVGGAATTINIGIKAVTPGTAVIPVGGTATLIYNAVASATPLFGPQWELVGSFGF